MPGAPQALRRLVAACRPRGGLRALAPRRARDRRLAAARELLGALGDDGPRELRRVYVDGVPGRLVVGDRYLILVPGTTLAPRPRPRVLTRDDVRYVGVGFRRVTIWLDGLRTIEIPVGSEREARSLRGLIAPPARVPA